MSDIGAREARFGELGRMTNSQLADLLRTKQDAGKPRPRPSLLMGKTRAELIWLIVDAEMPLQREATDGID